MQPDKPQLCRFWLTGLLSALRDAKKRKNLSNALHPMTILTDFLWRYTWAAVPQPLRKPLQLAVNGMKPLMQWKTVHIAETNSSPGDHTPLNYMVLRWVMQSDPVFRRWHVEALGREVDYGPMASAGLKCDGETMMRCAPSWLLKR